MRGVSVHRSNVGRLLHRLGLSHKKTLLASEQQRADVRQARELWIGRRKRFFNKALARLIFIDETSTNTKLTNAPAGRRKASASGPMRPSANGRRRPSSPGYDATVLSRRGSSTRG
ncbi:winged helix-turn-helix domain-containing protein [Mesorhizobium sp. LNJC391B00]|uniref:winged helix-turn-helix domain-containing protein n=1 Tax=Mesorhizobium sp. LNJC391B00 TaxID=1287273 RepID=UPI001FD95F97|nr:winged helix-turn-helix domain-containing protein [Mesorhizobium sp. LNJC391B00]